MEKLKMERSYQMHCLLRWNVGDVKMMMLMPYMTIDEHNAYTSAQNFNRKLKINSMSIRTGNIESIMTQKDHKCRYQKWDFHLSTPFRN